MGDETVRKQERNYGIDLLRMLCMYMIPVLHVLGQGSVMVRTGINDATYYSCWFLEILCLCAINCYGLISGYVGLYASFKPKRLLRMALTVEFYTVVILILFRIVSPELINRDVILQCLLPIQWKSYWYYSAYVGLFFLMPFLNKGVLAMQRKERDHLMLVLFLMFCVFTMVCKTFVIDPFELIGGYSLIWLCVLYVFGACARDSRLLQIPRTYCIGGFFLSAFLAWGWKYLVEKQFIPAPEDTTFARMFVTYTSPTIFVCGLLLFLLFVNTDIRSAVVKAVIGLFSPLVFYVYIIHTHPLVWEYSLKEAFKSWRNLPPTECIPLVLLAALGIYLSCLAVELIRSRAEGILGRIIGKRSSNIK